MRKRFDLLAYDQVKASSPMIYARLSNGSMPPPPPDDNGPWPEEWIELFKRWMDEGCPP